MGTMEIAGRPVGPDHPPLVIAEVGINHLGDLGLAKTMVTAAVEAGCECVKFQSHVVEDEMIPNDVVPGNADKSIWDIMSECALDAGEEAELKSFTEQAGAIFLSTPFSRAAAVRLEALDVPAFKIGSGECNNYPLIEHIAAYGKPVILSTGMNDVESVTRSVEILRRHGVSFGLLHCTSIYPTPYEKVRLGAMLELREAFPDAAIGLSDHTVSIYPCLGAAALGANILERHFTSSLSIPGPDIPVSMDPEELKRLVEGSRAIHASLGGSKQILEEEQPTIRFAYASVVAIRDIDEGERLDRSNIWVKRPGTGEIPAAAFEDLLGKRARRPIRLNEQLKYDWIE